MVYPTQGSGSGSGAVGAHKNDHVVGGSDAFSGATDELSFQAEKLASAPANVKGRVYYNTVEDKLYVST